MNGMFAKLSSIKGLLSEKGTPELVFTIYGRKKVLMKIGEMLDSARTTFMISSPRMQDIRSELSDRFKDAQARGVKITIITEPAVKVPSADEIFRRKGIIATDVIVDGNAGHDRHGGYGPLRFLRQSADRGASGELPAHGRRVPTSNLIVAHPLFIRQVVVRRDDR